MKRFIHDGPEFNDIKSETFPDGKRFYILPDGTKLPSITTVLSYSKSESLKVWKEKVGEAEAKKISRKAANRGTKLHNVCESYVANLGIPQGTFPDTLELFKKIQPLLDKHVNNIKVQERTLFSKRIGVAGKTDLIAGWDGILSVIDYKSSSKPKPREWILDYLAQATAYALMYQDMFGVSVPQIVIIIAVEGEPEPQVFIEKPIDNVENLVKYISAYRKEMHYEKVKNR